MKEKCVSGDRSFVHERISLNAAMSMVVAVHVPHAFGETSHTALHVVTNHSILSAMFPDVFVAFSLHRSFSFGTVKALSSSMSSDSLVDCCKDKIDRTDSIAFDHRYLLHVDANTFCQQFRYCATSMTIRDAIFETVYTLLHKSYTYYAHNFPVLQFLAANEYISANARTIYRGGTHSSSCLLHVEMTGAQRHY